MLELDCRWENLDQAFDALMAECGSVVQGITAEAWNTVLRQTPQFYGRAVASWTCTIGTPVFVDRSGEIETTFNDETEPVIKGNPTAIGLANSHNLGATSGFKLGDTIWFANGVDHGEGPYSAGLEDGSIRLRAGNRPGHMVSRALDAVQSKYADGVSPASATRLKGLRIGL